MQKLYIFRQLHKIQKSKRKGVEKICREEIMCRGTEDPLTLSL